MRNELNFDDAIDLLKGMKGDKDPMHDFNELTDLCHSMHSNGVEYARRMALSAVNDLWNDGSIEHAKENHYMVQEEPETSLADALIQFYRDTSQNMKKQNIFEEAVCRYGSESFNDGFEAGYKQALLAVQEHLFVSPK